MTRPSKKNIVKKLTTTKPRADLLENKNGTKPGKPGALRFGTWNIRSLYKPRALKCITSIIKKYYVDLVALQEVRYIYGQDLDISNQIT